MRQRIRPTTSALLQAAILALAALTIPWWGGPVAARLIAVLPYAHGDSKLVLLIWQVGLRWLPELLRALALTWLIGAVSVRWPRRFWPLGIAAALALLRPLGLEPWLIAGIGLSAIGMLPWRLRSWGALPGVWLLLPLPVARAAEPKNLWFAAILGGLGQAALLGLSFLLQIVSSFEPYERALLAPWPADRLGPNITLVSATPAGLKSDFHDLDLVDLGPVDLNKPDAKQRQIIAIAESQRQLLSWDADAPATPPQDPVAAAMPPWWGVNEGLVMDSASALLPGGPRTWTVGGPSEVVAWTQEAGAWKKVGRSARLPEPIHHVYTEAVPELGALYLFAVGARSPHDPARSIELDLQTLEVRRSLRYVDPQGRPLPTTRDVLWIPTLRKFLLVPDMGDTLYLVDPDRPAATPWLSLAALNGRPAWVQGVNRVILPLPERAEIWIVDPAQPLAPGGTWKIPTQPGVRTADIDPSRGLLLTASVLTGQVMAQRIDLTTGAGGGIVGVYGTVMPMARELVADPAQGRAWLTTWTGLYQVDYR